MNLLIETLKLVYLEGCEKNFFRKLNVRDLLIINDFGMVILDGKLQLNFEQIIDDRYDSIKIYINKLKIFQLPRV